MSGRGFGKSRAGAEWLADKARQHPSSEWAVVAPTAKDWRKCAEDPTSGLIAILQGDLREDVAGYNRSLGKIRLKNGAIIHLESADKPDRLRGYNLWGAWTDEISSWRYRDAWDAGLAPALRLGPHPQICATTTPKPVPLVRDLAERDDGSVTLTTGSTWDNADNLAPMALAELRKRYEGTRLGRQELFGELLLDVPGALWTIDIISDGRRSKPPENTIKLVVSVDPAVTAGEDSDETGIIVAAVDDLGHGWVIEDLTCRSSPDTVARTLCDAYHRHRADWVIGEVNNGGDYIGALIHTVDADIPFKSIRATRGKVLRAEPVAAAYEQGRVHHLGVFGDLESQMCSMVPGIELEHDDRLDAMVYAMTELGLAGAGITWEEVYAPPSEREEEGEFEMPEHDPWAVVY